MKLLLLAHHAEQKNSIETALNALGHEFSSRISSDFQGADAGSSYDAVLLQLSSVLELVHLADLCRRLRTFSCCARSRILALGEQPLSDAEFQMLLDAGVQDYLEPPLDVELLQRRLLILERHAQETAQLYRKIQYLTERQQRRQRTEEALRTSMQHALKKGWDFLEILNDSLEDAIVTLTMPERMIDYGNRAVEKILGYTIEECRGESFGIFFPELRSERMFIKQLSDAITRQRPSLHTENLLQRASGEQFTAEITTTFMYEQERLTRTVISIRDITERKEMEKALEQERTSLALKVQERTGELQLANKELARASEHKDRFLANMSHELRTPLNAILGYAKILQRGRGLTYLQQEGLHTIQKSGEHLLHLITDILDVSKIEAGRLELHLNDLYLPEFLSHIAKMIRVRAEEKAIRFCYENNPDLPQGIRADEKRLRQVLINLLDNAIKFTTQGGVVFRITLKERYGQYAWLLFEIEDSGPGISPEYLDEIFQPFHQVGQHSYSPEGTGLGLAICRQLVRLMGSELVVRSVPGAGSTFSFTLEVPVLEGNEAIARGDVSEIIGYAGPARRIMLVDDKPENRAILLNTLQPLGFELLEAEDGLDCLANLSTQPFDLILLDLRMAELDGFETARRIRALPGGEQFKIVAISASVFEETRQKSLDAGCDTFLPKPIDDLELLTTLQQLLQLEWVCQPQSNESEARLPSAADFPPLSAGDFEELQRFARHGNMTRILQTLERLEEQDVKYQPLVETLRSHSASFRMKEILDTIDALEIENEAR